MKLAIVNGPNLNLLGQRNPAFYGTKTLGQIQEMCTTRCETYGLTLDFFQSNYEGALVEKIQESQDAVGLIINAGGYSHTSIAIHDALQQITAPIIELHLSNVHAREDFRKPSFVSLVATGLIVGLGANGYCLAIDAVANLMETEK